MNITCVPATTPIWLIICCAAPAMPRSWSATAFAMAAAIAGEAAPMPTPDSTSESTTIQGEESTPTVDSSSSEAPMLAIPIVPMMRSPTRVVSQPASGPAIANDSGRAMLSWLPSRVPMSRTFSSSCGVSRKPPM